MKYTYLRVLCLVVTLVLAVGCASEGTKVRYRDVDSERLTPDFGATDLHLITEKMVNSLVLSPVLDGQPVVYVDYVRNNTHEHIDTKSITDRIRTVLLKHGKVKITARSDIPDTLLQEQEFQRSELADPSTVVKMGKLAGAKYILFGDITSIEKRAGRKRDIYFKITLNITNVQNGLIEWAEDKEIRKEAIRRYIGW